MEKLTAERDERLNRVRMSNKELEKQRDRDSKIIKDNRNMDRQMSKVLASMDQLVQVRDSEDQEAAKR